MSDQLDPAIAVLIETGRAKLKAAAAAIIQRETDRAHERQSAIAARATDAWTAIGNLLPDSLLYYAGLCSEIEPEGCGDVIYRLEVPNCSAITIVLKREPNGYQPSANDFYGTKRGIYCVSKIGLVTRTDDDEPIGFTIGENGHHVYTNDLDVALAVAAEQGQNYLALQSEAETKTAQLVALRSEKETAAAARQVAAEDRRLALIAKIIDDDLAVRLVELFLAIQSDRDNWSTTVRDATEHADSLAERYEHRLAEQQRQADLAIRTRQNEVDIAQREADDLQAQLARIKRQAQFA